MTATGAKVLMLLAGVICAGLMFGLRLAEDTAMPEHLAEAISPVLGAEEEQVRRAIWDALRARSTLRGLSYAAPPLFLAAVCAWLCPKGEGRNPARQTSVPTA